MDFDVLIVGGSLAGSSAAMALKDSGIKVGIIDKAVFPRRKPCGEGLSGRGLEALRGLGIPLNELLSLGKLFDGFMVESNGSTTQIPTQDGFGLGIARWKLDSFLLSKVKEFATLITDEVIQISLLGEVQLKSSKLSAKVIIVADGNGKITKSFNPSITTDTRAGVSAEFSGYSVRSIDKVCVKICDEFELYVTPLDSETLNVAVLGIRNSDTNIREALLSNELNEWLRDSLGFNGSLSSKIYGRSGLCNKRRRSFTGRVLFAGDSVEQFDPLGGMGMSHAILTGITAGRTAQDIVRNPGMIHSIIQAYDAEQNLIAKPIRRHTKISQRLIQLARVLPSSVNLVNTPIGNKAVKFIQRMTI